MHGAGGELMGSIAFEGRKAGDDYDDNMRGSVHLDTHRVNGLTCGDIVAYGPFSLIQR